MTTITATKIKQTKIINIQDLPKLCYPIPQSWTKAAGLLRHKRKALERHLKQVRLEWDRADPHHIK